MRALIHEMAYERPIAAGRYEYEEGGAATGAVELWKLTAAPEGYRFLRVDLNAEASSGDNVLYHLTLDAAGRPERLKFHFFRQRQQIRGDLLFTEETAVLTREVNGERLESEVPFAAGAPFWFPASAGLSLLARAGAQRSAALTLSRAQTFALWPTSLTLSPGPPRQLQIMGRTIATRMLTARWEDEERTLWLDEHHWPLRVQRGNLVATEKRYVRYASAR